MEAGRLMGSLHPALIHFPIVLLIVAVALEAWEYLRPDRRLAFSARLLLLLGAASTLFAFVCGNFAEIWAARSGIPQDPLEYHEFLATVTSWAFVGLTAWRALMRETTPRRWRAIWILSAVGACVLLGFTGRHGAALVYEHGAAVQGIAPLRTPTDEDLAALAQRQDADSIFYSNKMHHVFGWMVLLLSGLLLLDHVSPRISERARRFGPLLLLAGGVFLLIFSDQDAWPLYVVKPYRPITDKEVLLHKTYAALMLLAGGWGLWRAWRRRPGEAASEAVRVQARLMAVFALVGGALLFTHVHSAAPYANVAVGVYLHHTALGVFALLIGATKLADDLSPRPSRARALAFPALMCCEAILLINYNEGLPWFMGYRDYSARPAHGGLVSPFAGERAEFEFDPETARATVYLMRRAGAEPLPMALQDARLVVRVGEEATEARLVPEGPQPGGSAVWRAHLPFLRDAVLFSVQARARVAGRAAIADFEPWIDPARLALARPPAYAWACAMHPEQGGPAPGLCALCGMPLSPSKPTRPPGALHDFRFDCGLAMLPASPRPGEPVHLILTPRDSRGAILPSLQTVHTKKLHLIVVSDDLSFFDHVHPEPQPDGTLAMDYRFPHAGGFILFADFTPPDAANQVFRRPVTVTGKPPLRTPLNEPDAPARVFGRYRVELATSPAAPRSGEEAALTFRLSKDAKPVTDLQPYLGAGGHCVILSEDTRSYLHSHPIETRAAAGGGPEVSFHTKFLRPGRYKAWGQFLHGGHVLTADFVFRVQ